MSPPITPPADRRLPSLNECLRTPADKLQQFKFQLFAELRALGFPHPAATDLAYFASLAAQTWRELDETWLHLFQTYPELPAGLLVPAAFLANNMKQETALVAMEQAGTTLGFGLADGVRTLRAALYSMTFKREQQVADFVNDPTKDAGLRALVAILWKDVTDQESAPTDKGAARQKAAEQRQKKWQDEVGGWHLSSQQSQDVGLLLAAAQGPAPASAAPPPAAPPTTRKRTPKKALPSPAGGPPVVGIPVGTSGGASVVTAAKHTVHKGGTRRSKTAAGPKENP